MTIGRLPEPVGSGAVARRREVERIRRLVAEGRYRVPAGEVADAILSEIARRRRDGI